MSELRRTERVQLRTERVLSRGIQRAREFGLLDSVYYKYISHDVGEAPVNAVAPQALTLDMIFSSTVILVCGTLLGLAVFALEKLIDCRKSKEETESYDLVEHWGEECESKLQCLTNEIAAAIERGQHQQLKEYNELLDTVFMTFNRMGLQPECSIISTIKIT